MHKKYCIQSIFVAILSSVPCAQAQIQFEDVSSALGLTYKGDTWGLEWGDFNADGRPDIRVGNHNYAPPSFYLNTLNSFVNVRQSILPGWVPGDVHGTAWADMDNDGDQDLYETAGNADDSSWSRNRMYRNMSGTLVDQAIAYGLGHATGRDRSATWLDWNRDGRLDFLAMTLKDQSIVSSPSDLFEQRPDGGFEMVTTAAGIDLQKSTTHAQLADLSGDGTQELIVVAGEMFPRAIYSLVDGKYVDIQKSLGLSQKSDNTDTVIADFNNDLYPDIFVARSKEYWGDYAVGADLGQVDERSINVALVSAAGGEVGVDFESPGNLLIKTAIGDAINSIVQNEIFIGSAGWHPTQRDFSLTPDSASGMPSYTPGTGTGAYIGYDPATRKWRIRLSSATRELFPITVESDVPITGLAPVNFAPSTPAAVRQNLYLVNQGGTRFVDKATTSGFATPTSCVSAAAGDFDNDMDVDLYLVCTGHVTNQPNLLFENLGNGTFSPVAMAGGAAGSQYGRGEGVATADYNVDGFIDLFVTNGHCCKPHSLAGPNQLFRNTGNANHWIELDLEGVVSNRDGIGARVVATAGGVKQLREQDQGMHRWTQNHKRLHFGLSANPTLSELTVTWPSGVVQQLFNVPADQLLHVLEPVAADFNGQPAYTPGTDDGVFLWRDQASGAYRLRVSSLGTGAVYQVKVVSSMPLEELNNYNLQTGETLSQSMLGFTLTTTSATQEAGADFSLPAAAKAMISVERNGVANPRQLHVGSSGRPMTPVGWILPSALLPSRPSDSQAGYHGLFLGKGSTANAVEVRWRADAGMHQDRLTLMTSDLNLGVGKFSFEAGDALVFGGEAVDVVSTVDNWGVDGLKVLLPGPLDIAVAYQRDGLLPLHRVNNNGVALKYPNAYWLQQGN